MIVVVVVVVVVTVGILALLLYLLVVIGKASRQRLLARNVRLAFGFAFFVLF